MTDAPERIWDFWPHDGGSPVIWRRPCPFPADDADVFEYIRADLHEAQIAALRDRVQALSLALSHIDAMDPEERMIGGVSEHAAKGLLLRMGEVARAVLKADQ